MSERWMKNYLPLLREAVKAQTGSYPEFLPEPDQMDKFELQLAEAQLEGLVRLAIDDASKR